MYVPLVCYGGGDCENSKDCGDDETCGVSFANSPPTYGVCDTFGAYASSHLSCMAGATCSPFCGEDNNDVIYCMGDYSLSGYNQPPGTKFCGCPDWEAMGVDTSPVAPCQTWDKNWEEKFLFFLMQGCPMAYDFAYSDMASTIACNTVRAYTIKLCPNDTEVAFFG